MKNKWAIFSTSVHLYRFEAQAQAEIVRQTRKVGEQVRVFERWIKAGGADIRTFVVVHRKKLKNGG